MKRYLLSLILSTTFFFHGVGQTFNTIAEDDAGNYSGTGAPNFGLDVNDNGGSGFNAWTWDNSGSNRSAFLGFGPNDGHGDIGNPSFGFFAQNDGSSINAYRSFNDLKNEDQLEVEFTINFRAGAKGIELFQNGTGVFLFQASNAFDDKYEYRDQNGDFTDTGWPYQANSIFKLTVKQLSDTNVDITVERTNSAGHIVTLSNVSVLGRVDEIRFFNQNAGGEQQNFYFNNLKIERPTYSTIADGDFTNTATWDGGVVPNGNGVINIDHDVNLNAALTLNGELNIATTKTLDVNADVVFINNGTVNVNGDLVFKSTTATTTAQYGNSTGTITGDVTVERFIPAKRAFRLLSSAVSGVSIANAWQQQTHITGVGGAINGFDPTTTNNPSMFTFDNSLVDQSGGQAWEAIANTNATNLNAGTPYRLLVRGSRSTVDLTDNESPSSDVTLSAKGTLAAGSLATGTDLPAMATLSEQHSFIGNPYQAVVDATALNYNGDVNSNYIYVWDAKIGGVNGRGGFVIVDTTTGDPVTDPLAPPPGTSQANQFIMPGQAFFIRNNEIINTPPSITFTEAAKATGESQIEVFSTSSEVYLNLSLYTQDSWDASDYESDALGIRWSPNYTTLVSDEDSRKLGNPGENFAVNNSNTLVGIEKRNLPESEELIPLFINNYEEEDYVIHNQFENLPEDAKFYIIDDYLETTTELVNGEAYNYSIDASIPASLVFNRFSIRFEPTTLSQTDFTENNFSLYPNPAENQLNINWNSVPNEDTQITIFNLVGQKVAEFTSNASLKTTSLPIQNLNAGMYILQIQSSDINTSRKFIKR